jgi:hypothetical protein
MTNDQLQTMSPQQRAEWLDSVSPISSFRLGQDVFCMHCDGVFKAEDVSCDNEGDPTCPCCKSSTPLDFHGAPWWREDLMDEDDEGIRTWRVKTIKAEAGRPRQLPEQAG